MRYSILRCYESFLLTILIVATNVIGYHYKNQQPPRITEHPVDTTVMRHEPATLNCHATGEPEPSIAWYKDGSPLRTAPEDARSHRVLLPAGNLFFLRVVHNRKDTDAGVYWCEASNALGKTRSHNATLTVAVIRDEFRLEPQNTRVTAGETIVMECIAPRGIPEPQVFWKKDGYLVETSHSGGSGGSSGRLKLVNGSNLQISDAKLADEGRYQCIAKNIAGTKESSVVTLKVHVKPFMIRSPKDQTVLAGSTVDFFCLVGGNPSPDIFWSRHVKNGEEMPLGRVSVLDDHTLRLENVILSDEGRYVCEATNQAGTVTSTAVLTVHSLPIFKIRPLAQTIESEQNVSFSCSAKGNPKPFVFWSLEGDRALIFPGNPMQNFQATTNDEGVSVLTLENANVQNSGLVIICSAINSVGSTSTRVRLTVTSKEDRPPPIITHGPSNQTVAPNSTVIFQCEAVGDPVPVISWYKENRPIFPSSSRIKVAGDSLELREVSANDSGSYTCVASSSKGKSIWNAYLSVENSTYNQKIQLEPIQHQPFLLPKAPNRPRILNQSETSVTITWTKQDYDENLRTMFSSSSENPSKNLLYQVEMFVREEKPVAPPAWQVVARRIPQEHFTQKFLQPGLSYVFLVRAENEHGLGPPSEPSDIVITETLDNRAEENWGNPGLSVTSEARANLVKSNIVRLTDAVPVSSTAIKLTWDILDAQYVEGLYIYCISLDSIPDLPRNYRMLTVLHTGDSSSFVVNNLEKWSNYQFFIVPFFKTVEGRPSNSRIVRTLEDVPTEAPQHMEARLLNSTSVYLEWKPPSELSLNGILDSYRVEIRPNGTNELKVIHVRSASSLLLTNLTAGVTYAVKVAAATKAGVGPFSGAAMLRLDPTSYFVDGDIHKSIRSPTADFITETWFIALLISMISVMVVLFTAIAFLRRQQTFSRKSLSGGGTGRSNGEVLTKYEAPLWLDKAGPLPEYSASLIDHPHNINNMVNMNGSCKGFSSVMSDDKKYATPDSRMLLPKQNSCTSRHHFEQDRASLQFQNYACPNMFPEYCRVSAVPDYAEVNTQIRSSATMQTQNSSSKNMTSFVQHLSSPYATTTLISRSAKMPMNFTTNNYSAPPMMFICGNSASAPYRAENPSNPAPTAFAVIDRPNTTTTTTQHHAHHFSHNNISLNNSCHNRNNQQSSTTTTALENDGQTKNNPLRPPPDVVCSNNREIHVEIVNNPVPAQHYRQFNSASSLANRNNVDDNVSVQLKDIHPKSTKCKPVNL